MHTEAASRLIVAADFTPDGNGMENVIRQIENLFSILTGTGAIIKFNSVLRALGLSLVKMAADHGLNVFADLKLNDIPNTLESDGKFLQMTPPRFLTVMCSTGVEGMRKLQETLPTTNILGVTVLTSMDEDETEIIFKRHPSTAVINLARLAKRAGICGVVCSSQELATLKTQEDLHGLRFITPGIRPAWSMVKSDDQKRIMPPAQAIKAGADYLVVGRPIIQASDPKEAFWKTVEEIQEALS